MRLTNIDVLAHNGANRATSLMKWTSFNKVTITYTLKP